MSMSTSRNRTGQAYGFHRRAMHKVWEMSPFRNQGNVTIARTDEESCRGVLELLATVKRIPVLSVTVRYGCD